MSKVIVERPRKGSHWKTWRRKGRFDPKLIVLDEDGHEADLVAGRVARQRATKSSMHGKWLNENLAPLRRYLLAQVGRPWNDVWSEICENLKPTSTVQQHVRDHIDDFVAVNTFLKDGRIYVSRPGNSPHPIEEPKWNRHIEAYVDPTTARLVLNPHYERFGRRRKRESQAKAADLETRLKRQKEPDKWLIKLDDGNWWDVTLADANKMASQREPGTREVIDVIEQGGLSNLSRQDRYGYSWLVAIAKRPLSKRELKLHGLRET